MNHVHHSSNGHKRRIGLLTGGGDAPGLNSIIEAVVRVLSRNDFEIIGICDGFEGIFSGRTQPLTIDTIRGAHSTAGTLLGTSNKSRIDGREKEFAEKFSRLKLEGLIAAGGDGTFAALQRVIDSIPTIGVPKTIDNDLSGTELTFGFDTACSVVADSADALRATAEAHHRAIVIETMGRNAGWIALGGGLASYADVILVPERPFSREKLLHFLNREKNSGRKGLILVASEGARADDEKAHLTTSKLGGSHGNRYEGFSNALVEWINAESSWESRNVVLGHLQRSKAPTTTDRFLTSAMGVEVAELALNKKWQTAVVYRNGRVTHAPITDIMQPAKMISNEHPWIDLAQQLGIFI